MVSMDKLTNVCKQYGYIFQGSEIYGGLANTWDYGPLGVELKNNIKKAWWQEFVQKNKNIYGLDSAILMNPKVWAASGHVASFSDPLIDCKKCKSRHRADKLIEEFTSGKCTGDGWSNEKLENYISDNHITCPKCGSSSFTNIRQFNLLFETSMGVTEEAKNTIYLRGETAQGIFVNFLNVQRTMRAKIPFGIGQIGKAFRNEITPGNFIFRQREFEQMELEYFINPKDGDTSFAYFRKYCMDFLLRLGIRSENLRFRDHSKEELVFYSKATTDIEYNYPQGFGELWGIANRTNYDLKTHTEHSDSELLYLDPLTNEKYIPHVIEPSVGVDRLFLAIITDAYREDVLEDGSTREVMSIHPFLAPYKIAVLPLVKKHHSEKALEIFDMFSKYFMCTYDETGNIGKRYRRQDIAGTPFCITVDDETLNNNTVTIRDRDTMEQIALKIDEVKDYIEKKLEF